ncbi:MAG TPA: VacB/RNase II family 3'-5' exoribonuclease [Bacilli bacterium]|nr:VacB/RNase II family 3'-5' exoribonuclease [Bacilli bacterium]
MKEVVLKLLDSGKALNFNEIVNSTGIRDKVKLSEVLEELESDLIICKNRKNKYVLFENSKLLKGQVTIIDRDIFVMLDDYEHVNINERNLHGARNGDTVSLKVINNVGNQKYGEVVSIKRDDSKKIIGEVIHKNKKLYIKYNDFGTRYYEYKEPVKNLYDGALVLLNQIIKKNNNVELKIVEVIGHKDDPNIDLISILKKRSVRTEFPEEVERELKNIPDEVTNSDINSCLERGGEDLRDERTVTIDGDDTKDFDDAITIKKIDNLYDLKVSIANVSNYVKVNTGIFNEAMYRGTSTYLPGSNVPMLPRKLSNGICSLNPNEDRLALTFEALIDEEGKVVDFSIYDSIIKSKKKMTYNEVNEILENGVIPNGYEKYVEDIKLMNELHKILRAKKIAKGFIDFDIKENYIKLDENNKPTDIFVKERKTAEKIIEDFMVVTGELASKYLDNEKIQHVYRIHGEPYVEKFERVTKYLDLLKIYTDRLANPTAKNIQIVTDELKNRKEYLIIARELLKCMPKAIYSTKNIGHFALCSESDCQVTSPIRRAGDLLNHILIRENIYQLNKGKLNSNNLFFYSNQASITERNAAACEVEAKKLKMAEYMQNHIGETYEGIISYINNYGFCVELPNLVEGFVDKNRLKDDKYNYQEEKFALIGSKTGRRYFLGDKVEITVAGVDINERMIYFDVLDKKSVKVKKII